MYSVTSVLKRIHKATHDAEYIQTVSADVTDYIFAPGKALIEKHPNPWFSYIAQLSEWRPKVESILGEHITRRGARKMSFPETYHLDLIESQYRQWKQDPGSVSKDWDFFFQGFELPQAECQVPQLQKPPHRHPFKPR